MPQNGIYLNKLAVLFRNSMQLTEAAIRAWLNLVRCLREVPFLKIFYQILKEKQRSDVKFQK